MTASIICSIHINKRALTKQDRDEQLTENLFASHYVKSGMELIFSEKKTFNKSFYKVKSGFLF